MFGVILKATNNFFEKGLLFCISIYVKKVMKLLAFRFEQPSYLYIHLCMYIIPHTFDCIVFRLYAKL